MWMSRTSPDGEEGYPGTLEVEVGYSLEKEKALRIEYRARAVDADTVLNLTNHSYFNLDGVERARLSSIEQHSLRLHASRVALVDSHMIPTSVVAIEAGSPFDFFSKPKLIGKDISRDDHPIAAEQIKIAGGYDHSFRIDNAHGSTSLVLAAELRSEASGREMRVLTTQPYVHLYSGNFLTDECVGRGGSIYGFRSGLCLETQQLPDSPNRDNSTLLKKGDEFRSTTVYEFGITPK